MKIVFITTSLPYPPDTGGKIRVYSLVRALARRHQIGLICFEDPEADPSAVQAMRDLGIEVVTVPNLVRQRPATKRAYQLLSLFSPYPFQRYRFYSPWMQRAIDSYLRTHDVDLVDVEFAQMGYYRFPPGLPVILGQHNVEHEILWRSYRGAAPSFRKLFNFMEWWKFRRDEIAACRRATLITTTSEHDRQALAAHVPSARLRVIPNGVDTTYFQRATCDEPDPNTIVFTGLMNYYPNVDGLRYFVRDVLPLVRRERAAAKFYAVGRDPTPEIQSYNLMPGVVVTGPVADVRGFFERAAIAVVPLRFGGGTRLKILEAMAMGCPIVSTSAGAEGIEVTDGENILIADDPAAMSHAIVTLLRDAPQRARLAAAGRRLVEKRYDWSSVASTLEATYVDAFLLHARRVWSAAPVVVKSLPASNRPVQSVAAPTDKSSRKGTE